MVAGRCAARQSGTVLPQFDSLAGRILLKDFVAALPSLVIGQAANRPCSAHRMRFPPNPYLSTCSIVQRLTCRTLEAVLAGSLPLTVPHGCTSAVARLGSAACQRNAPRPAPCLASDRAFPDRIAPSFAGRRAPSESWSWSWSWSRPLAVDVSKSSDRDRNSTPILCRPSTTGSPQVSLVSGGDKVDRVGGRSLTAIIWRLNPASLPRRWTPEQGGLRTRFW